MQPSTPREDHRHAWLMVPPFVSMALGLLLLFFWLWGNLVQVQTSEAWILHDLQTVSLLPHLSLVSQLILFWTGKLSQQEVIAATWAWSVQIALLLLSIGLERSQLLITRRYQSSLSEGVARAAILRARIFKAVMLLLVTLNCVADLDYSAGLGLGGQLAFALATLTMSFFFGLAGLHLFLAGLSEVRL